MSQEIISQIATDVNSRIAGGSPFTSGSSAWQGSEKVADLPGGAFLAIAFTSGTKIVSLRATTQTQLLGQLAIAERIDRGVYQPLADQAAIERWLNQITPGQAADGESKSLLEIALTAFEQKNQWDNEPVTVWRNGTKEAYLRNEKGFITLTLWAESTNGKLTGRRYSKALVVGYYHPQDCAWLESENVRLDYGRWVEQARRAVA